MKTLQGLIQLSWKWVKNVSFCSLFLAFSPFLGKFRRMAFSIAKNDFFDFIRFFYDEVTLISNFFEETCLKMVNFVQRAFRRVLKSLDSFSIRKYSVTYLATFHLHHNDDGFWTLESGDECFRIGFFIRVCKTHSAQLNTLMQNRHFSPKIQF